MKIAGFLLSIAGWLLAILAIVLLRTEASRGVFVLAGIGVQVVALALVFRAHRVVQRGRS